MEFTFDKLYLWLGFLMNVFSEENPYNLSDSEREKLMALLEESEQTQHGVDITKAWTTVVEQTSIIGKVSHKAYAEAYDSFKKDYENRLKADMVAMLTELQLEIEELEKPHCHNASHADGCVSKWKVEGVIQQKIEQLKGVEDGKDN